MSDIRVVITGGGGYLGSHLVRAMAARGWRVYVLAQLGASQSAVHGLGVDIINCGDLSQAFARIPAVDIVIHAATCYGRNGETQSEMIATNLVFPMRVLELAGERGCRLFCNTDSALSRNASPYGLSKKQFVDWLQLPHGCVRVLNLELDQFYGPGESKDKFVTWMVRQCLESKRIPLTSGVQRRRFLHVADLTRGYLSMVDRAWASDVSFEHYRIVSEVEKSVCEYCEMLHRMTESSATLDFGALPTREHELDEESNAPVAQSFGWHEEISLEDGFAEVIAYERGLVQK